jgi:hypothetical protein
MVFLGQHIILPNKSKNQDVPKGKLGQVKEKYKREVEVVSKNLLFPENNMHMIRDCVSIYFKDHKKYELKSDTRYPPKKCGC